MQLLSSRDDAHHVAFGQIRVLARHQWGELRRGEHFHAAPIHSWHATSKLAASRRSQMERGAPAPLSAVLSVVLTYSSGVVLSTPTSI